MKFEILFLEQMPKYEKLKSIAELFKIWGSYYQIFQDTTDIYLNLTEF